MARDIIPMEPIESECPHCKCPLFVDYQIAVYESGDSFQFVGLRERLGVKAVGLRQGKTLKSRKVSFTIKAKAREGEPKPKRKRVSFFARR